MASYFPKIMLFGFFPPKFLTTFCTFLDVALNQKTINYKTQNSANTFHFQSGRLGEFCHQKEKFSFLWHEVKDKHKNHCKSWVKIQLGFKTLHARGHFTLSWVRAGAWKCLWKSQNCLKCHRNSMVGAATAPRLCWAHQLQLSRHQALMGTPSWGFNSCNSSKHKFKLIFFKVWFTIYSESHT